MKKKFLCLALALTMLLSLVACGGGNNNAPAEPTPDTPPAENNTPTTPDAPEETGFTPYTYEDSAVYEGAMSDFYSALLEAKACKDVDEMYAKYAIAEAKLMETGTLQVYAGDGGNYGISRIAPRSCPTVMWGSDTNRYETYIIATELLKNEDRAELTKMWNELRGTGTYEQAAKDYLVGKGYTLTNEYGYSGYSSDPETWDTLSAWTDTTSKPLCNTVDGLVKYDMENEIQPALAESWETSEDGLTWTFHLRDAIWTDSQGRKVDDVKADDWVASLQHLFDFYGDSAAEVLAPVVENGLAYCNGEITDFTQVGVKAIDDKTLEYKLTRPVPAFLSMMTYCGMFAPLCRSYYESQGGTFGVDTHENGNYGTGPNNIAYCGPYLITSWTPQNSFVFEASESYWNAGNINITKITWPYNDDSDALKAYHDTLSGILSGCGLGTSALKACREDGYFDDYARISSLTGTTRIGFTNLNRQMFTLFNDTSAGISGQSHESTDAIDRANGVFTSDILDDAARTHVAMNNQNFRLALSFGWDRCGYQAQVVGDEMKSVSVRNTYVPGNFVFLSKDTTVDINGTATTFPAGTYYGAIAQAQLDADGYPIKVWDPAAEDGVGSGDGFDGYYNVDNCRSYLAKAVEELAAAGVEVTKENPIQIDYYYGEYAESFINRANAYSQSIEASTEGLVKVNLIPCADATQLNSTNFFNPTGAENCCDMAIGTGWTADYGDPASFLDNLLPDGDGYQTKNLGLW